MLSQLEQACKTYSTEFSCGLIEFDSDWQRIFVTALTFHLDQAIYIAKYVVKSLHSGFIFRENTSHYKGGG